MSRESASESAVSVSRDSSMTRSPTKVREEGDKGHQQEEGKGLTSRMLSMLGKPISHNK